MVSQRRWRWLPWPQSLATLIVSFGSIWHQAWPFYSKSAKAGEMFSIYASKWSIPWFWIWCIYRLFIKNSSPMAHLQLFAPCYDNSHWSCCHHIRMQSTCRYFCSIDGYWSDLRQDGWYHSESDVQVGIFFRSRLPTTLSNTDWTERTPSLVSSSSVLQTFRVSRQGHTPSSALPQLLGILLSRDYHRKRLLIPG